MNSNSQGRIYILSFAILAFSLLLVAKLFFVQIVKNNGYEEAADRQYAAPAGTLFERGSIFFRKKDMTLVSASKVVTGFRIAIVPKNIVDVEGTYAQINAIIPINKEEYDTKVLKKNDPYEEIATRVSKEEVDKVSALKLPGVSVHKQNWRFNPGGSLASHALGFVAFKGDDLTGRYGVEQSYNNILARKKDDLYVNFFAEVFSNIGDTLFERKDKEGDIVLTIEPSVQQYLEERLLDAQEKWQGESIGGIIIDPNNGEIIAMAKAPAFDVNTFSKYEDPKIFGNPLVENVFELGSVIKPLVMAAAINEGVVTPKTTYTDNGFVIVNTKQINNFDKKARGPNTSMQDVLNQSLNTGMVFTEQRLGNQKFAEYMRAYGIGEKTGIDLPNETRGLIDNLKSPRDIEYANAAFGQGIAVTPVEAVRAFSVLANGGYLVTPHVVTEIQYKDGGVKKMEYPVGPQVITKETSDTISNMLITVVDKGMQGGIHSMERYSIGAKTGTAQMAKENGGGYYDDKHLHSFFGYFPAHKPRFLVFLYIVDPKGVQFAAQSLLPPFFETAKFMLNYYDVPPDR